MSALRKLARIAYAIGIGAYAAVAATPGDDLVGAAIAGALIGVGVFGWADVR